MTHLRPPFQSAADWWSPYAFLLPQKHRVERRLFELLIDRITTTKECGRRLHSLSLLNKRNLWTFSNKVFEHVNL
jgi:hypothetical protein